MQLNVKERLVLLQMLPGLRGNLATLRIIDDLMRDLGFTEEEYKELGFEADGDQLRWNESDAVKDVEIGPKARESIQGALRGLDKGGQLSRDHLSLCDKFEV